MFYGLSNIAGVIFVLGMVGYLTISEHWWYLLVYLVALPVAKLLAFICKLGVIRLWKKSDNIETLSRIKKHRIVGSLVIIVAIIIFFSICKPTGCKIKNKYLITNNNYESYQIF